MQVLLLSPVAGVDVGGGDVTYTEALLAHPPAGVTYTTYTDALEAGSLVERGRRLRHGRPRPADVAILGARAAEAVLRRSGVLFREPYRFLTVDPDAFDLVHAHVFAMRQVGSDVPLVTSSGFPLPVLYRDRFGWPARRAAAVGGGERAVMAALTVRSDVTVVTVEGRPVGHLPGPARPYVPAALAAGFHATCLLEVSGGDGSAATLKALLPDGT